MVQDPSEDGDHLNTRNKDVNSGRSSGNDIRRSELDTEFSGGAVI